MSLDKLKASWGSLDDSVDQKEIVVMKDLRKKSYNLNYKSLKSYRNWDLAGIPITFALPLTQFYNEEFNVLSIIVYYGICILLFVPFYLNLIKFKQIKMSDDIRTLRGRFEDYLKYNKMYNRACFILFPIFYVNFIWMINGTITILEKPITTFIIPSLFIICAFNAAMFYHINRLNKKYDTMLEDIKQLEELDMY